MFPFINHKSVKYMLFVVLDEGETMTYILHRSLTNQSKLISRI